MAKSKGNKGNLIGSFAFLIGVILAFIVGLISLEPWSAWLLVVIGLVVGLVNITASEAMGFMTASTVLVIVTALGGDMFAILGDWAPRMLGALLLVFVPATIIVALRAVFGLAKN